MSTPINLNKVRKARAQAEKKVRADENSVRFGLNKAEKEAVRDVADKIARAHEAHKRET